MLSKINVLAIIWAHLGTLRSYRTKRLMKRDYALFLGIPLLVSILLIIKNIKLDKDIIANLIAAMSIFAGFLFNLMALVYSLVDTIKKNIREDNIDSQEQDLKRQLLKETHINISYSVLISVLLVVLLCVTYFLPKFSIDLSSKVRYVILDKPHILGFISLLVEGSIYFFLINFGFTLLMILQRVHVLMKRRIAED